MLSIWNCKEMGNCCNNKLLDLRSQNKETEFFSPFVRHRLRHRWEENIGVISEFWPLLGFLCSLLDGYEKPEEV